MKTTIVPISGGKDSQVVLSIALARVPREQIVCVHQDTGFDHPLTYKHVEEIERFTSMKLPFRLSISLGAATDEKRRRLVPVAARTPIATVMEAARKHALTRRDRINLSYVCIRGENVSEDDARALSDLIGDTPVRLDLIDVTDHSGRYEPPSTEELRAFRDALSTYLKQPVARRYSGGADIKASCGSLAGGA